VAAQLAASQEGLSSMNERMVSLLILYSLKTEKICLSFTKEFRQLSQKLRTNLRMDDFSGKLYSVWEARNLSQNTSLIKMPRFLLPLYY
jgi:hypothetical protein